MNTLSDDDRRTLARAVGRARGCAEEGAREAIVQQTVGDAKPGVHLDEAGKRQRNRLRAHARQLGDQRRDDGTHAIERLVSECGYAHWHRMLFARFLAENSLLWHPDGYPVSLEELEEWAKEWGLRSRWEAAERCAAQILPQIFGGNELVLSIALSARAQKILEETLESIPSAVFKSRDALGWVYQFWQSAEKERINKSEAKIGADELPAVTQLFTEPYMVDFLLQNTLGAWWVGRHGRDGLPIEMPYLRFLDDGTPAAGTFEKWPGTAKELTILDPCCGSGHFLVAAFDLLVRFRMYEERLLPRVASELVIRDNLYGLELDPRCTQIAAFAVAFAAWTFPGVEQYFQLPELHVACVGLGIRAELSDWLALANGNTKFRAGMERLYTQFRNAPVLGSLIDPATSKDPLLEASFDELKPLLDTALKNEKWAASDEVTELGSVAQGVAMAAGILAESYTLVCTNPPYLGRGKQEQGIALHCSQFHDTAKWDLATCMYERCVSLSSIGGCCALVLPQNWMFSARFEEFRAEILGREQIRLLARLGAGAFETITGEVVKAVLLIASHESPDDTSRMSMLDAHGASAPSLKAAELATGVVRVAQQSSHLRAPTSVISFGDELSSENLLEVFAECYQGMVTGDASRFLRCHWEVVGVDGGRWERYAHAPRNNQIYESRYAVVLWEGGCGSLATYAEETREKLHDMHESGNLAWGKPGVAIGRVTRKATIYSGHFFDNSVAVITPKDAAHVPAVWCFCSSPEFTKHLFALDQKLSLTNATILRIPFDLHHWQAVAAEQYPNGIPVPSSNDPTQWLFAGDIPSASRPLQVAIARLVGYRWPDQCADPALDALTDNDGIVCFPAIRQEKPAADRLLDLLVKAYGNRWTTQTLNDILAKEGASGVTLDTWLRDQFFEAHCMFFQHRPFVWHVWDGLRDGFAALVHYHRLTRATMETLVHADLGDWIQRQELGQKAGATGAEQRLNAAKVLRTKLLAILEGEKPYDIFVRWKPLDAQPLGWEPDLDDGVRLNIRPFVEANVLRTPAKNLKGIDWRKDRGKDPTTAPWHKRFDGERINDHHTTLAEKRAARAAKKDGGR